MVDVVNIIGSGSLPGEFNLTRIAEDMGTQAKYDPNNHPGMYITLDASAPLITLYRTGKYITTGADSEEETYDIRSRFLQVLAEMGVLSSPEDEWFQIQNYVCTGEIGSELNLNALAVGLGLEETEYEPEQFPGLIYRPTKAGNVMLLFASGRVVITGSPDLETAENTFNQLSQRVKKLLDAEIE
jgi:transcription initiation factor TFIID TATA-box-binding protein